MTTAEEQQGVFEAAGRLGAMEVLGTQIGVIVSMLRAMYSTHPEPAKVRFNFNQLIDQLLASPYMAHDPDHVLVLRDAAANLLRPSADVI